MATTTSFEIKCIRTKYEVCIKLGETNENLLTELDAIPTGAIIDSVEQAYADDGLLIIKLHIDTPERT